MFIPGGYLAGPMLPWLLLAPVMPLLIILFRRPRFNDTTTSLIVLCVVSLMVSSFTYLIYEQASLTRFFMNFAIALEILCTVILLKTCTGITYHKYAMITAGLVFTAIFVSFILTGTTGKFHIDLVKIGYALLFVLSVSVILNLQRDMSRHLADSPEFWISAGVFFHYGLITFLLLLNHDTRPETISIDDDFGLMYTLINFLRYVFFSAGLLLYKKNGAD
jgi:hypothetical protein